MKNLLCLAGVLLFTLTTTYAQDCKLNEEAQGHVTKANLAMEKAKSETDYLYAIEELNKALQYAPDCPDIYFNIGFLYDQAANTGLIKDIDYCNKAIEYFKKYLEIKPDSQKKQDVQNKIYELEYRRDKLKLNGVLVAKGKSVFMNGKELDKDEVRSIMANTDALKLYNKGMSRYKTGKTLLVTGICIIGYGVPLIITGIIIKNGSKKYIQKAVDMYNKGGKETSGMELKFGFTGNDIGLALNF